MARRCEFCGKQTQVGNRVATRGKAKYLGGIGIRITGVTRRKFKPNIHRVRAFINGSVRRVKICTKCLKAGKIQKPGPRPKLEATSSS